MAETVNCLDVLLNNLKMAEDEEGIIGGDNFMGRIHRVFFENQPLIVKVAPNHPFVKFVLAIDGAYQCEAFMYQTVFPLFAKMQAEMKDSFKSYPKYFTSSTKALVLEDKHDFQAFNRLDTLTPRQALILARELGKFHAMSFVLRKKNPQLLQEISKKIRNERNGEDQNGNTTRLALTGWFRQILDILVQDRIAHDKCRLFSDNLGDCFDRHYSFDCDNAYGVIGHCDLWPCNLLFKGDEVCIIDWQTARVCSPAVDLSEILFSCCDARVRRDYGNDLVEEYYGSCAAHVARFGEDINELFPYKILRQHLKEYSGYGLCIAIRAMTMASISIGDIPNMLLAKNIEEYAAMWSAAKRDPNVYNDRVRNLIVDYISYGYDV